MTGPADSMQNKSSEIFAVAAAIGTGVVVSEIVRVYATRRDLMDDPIFWQVGYPASAFASLFLGIACPRRPWRWPLVLFATQAVWQLAVYSARYGVPNLFPLTFFVFALLSLPCIAVAYLGGWLARLARE